VVENVCIVYVCVYVCVCVCVSVSVSVTVKETALSFLITDNKSLQQHLSQAGLC
jgi:predicted ABC-type exoprotein transport system permease subunit